MRRVIALLTVGNALLTIYIVGRLINAAQWTKAFYPEVAADGRIALPVGDLWIIFGAGIMASGVLIYFYGKPRKQPTE